MATKDKQAELTCKDTQDIASQTDRRTEQLQCMQAKWMVLLSACGRCGLYISQAALGTNLSKQQPEPRRRY